MASPIPRVLRSAVRAAARSLLRSARTTDRPPATRASGASRTGQTTPSDRRPDGGSSPRPAGTPSSATGTRPVDVREALDHVSYDPGPDGDADPGEVVWTWIPYEEDPATGKDRPVVVLGREADGLYVAQMTSKDHDRDAEQEARWGRYWLDIGTGPWDARGRPSEVRLDRILRVPAAAVRREGATLGRARFDAIVQGIRMVADHAQDRGPSHRG